LNEANIPKNKKLNESLSDCSDDSLLDEDDHQLLATINQTKLVQFLRAMGLNADIKHCHLNQNENSKYEEEDLFDQDNLRGGKHGAERYCVDNNIRFLVTIKAPYYNKQKFGL